MLMRVRLSQMGPLEIYASSGQEEKANYSEPLEHQKFCLKDTWG